MLDVIIALVPALIASVVIFGFNSLILVAVCVLSCVLFEYLSRKIMKRDNTVGDLSAVVTGILLAFNLPVSMCSKYIWMPVLGSAVAIIVAKQFFGGIGQNFVNPALAGRIFLMMSFTTQMSDWTAPIKWDGVKAVSTATPMASLSSAFSNSASLDSLDLPSLLQMFLGNHGGCLGETCSLALILGLIYMFVKKVISPVIPLTYIGTVAVLMFIAGHGSIQFTLYEILGGGLLLGAIFMATDYTTSPITTKGKFIYAIGCGLLTVAIRLFGSMNEGVSFSILIMNVLVPHIERLTAPKPFGTVKEKKEDKANV